LAGVSRQLLATASIVPIAFQGVAKLAVMLATLQLRTLNEAGFVNYFTRENRPSGYQIWST
jgi:hypothetical protein